MIPGNIFRATSPGGASPAFRLFWGLLALCFAAVTCHAVFSAFHPVPFYDHWETVDLYQKWTNGGLTFHDFWKQHNEHRIFVPRVLILADYFVEAGRGYLLAAVILLLQAAHVILLSRAMGREARFTPQARFFLSCTALLFFFWLKQRENFMWSFQVAWMLNAVAVSLAAYGAAGLRAPGTGGGASARGDRADWMRLGVAALACLVAAGTLASGVFLPVIVSLLIWKSGAPRRFQGAWCAFGLLLIGAYLAGYHPPASHGSPWDAWKMETLLYGLTYLGNPFVGGGMPIALAIATGSVGLAAFLHLAFVFLRDANPGFYTRFAFAGTLYTVFAMTTTAVGRHSFGLLQAGSGRYTTLVVIFWFLILSRAMAVVSGRVRLSAWMLRALAAVLLLYIVPTQLLLAKKMRTEYVVRDEAALALMAGVGDSTALHIIYPHEKRLWERNAFLREHALSIYREPWTRGLGSVFPGRYGVDSSRVALRGILEESRPAASSRRPGRFVRGRLDATGAPVPEVLVFTRGGILVGYARTTKRPCAGCFSGFINGAGAPEGTVEGAAEGVDFEAFGLEGAEARARPLMFH